MNNKANYKKRINLAPILIILSIILIISIIISTCLGSTSISLEQTFQVIMHHLNLSNSSIAPLANRVVWELRLPRVLLGAIVGTSLAIAGVTMQVLVRNEMADPFILGVSSGASVMATLSMIFGAFTIFGNFALPIGSFIGSILTIAIVYSLSRVQNKIVVSQLLLSGLVISMMLDGVTKIITLSAPNSLGLHNAEFWMTGSLAGAKWEYLTLPTLIMLITSIYLVMNYRTLNILLLDEETALTMGVNVKLFQKILILISSLLVATTISVSGTIGFVGLISPHLARLVVGGDHKRVLPVSALIGALLVVWTDVVARLAIAPEELPIGALTAIIGGPIFIILLKRKRTH